MPPFIPIRISISDILEDLVMNGKAQRKFNNLYSGILVNSPESQTIDLVSNWHPVLEKWMKKKYIWTYELNSDEIETLIQSCQIANHLTHVSSLYKEELDEMVQRLEKSWIDGAWMFRLDSASTKDAHVGRPPYCSPREVIYSIATSARCYTNCFVPERRAYNKTLYFSEFDPKWNHLAEWRVFVKEGVVQAITQYACYEINQDLVNLTDEQLIDIASIIENYTIGLIQESKIGSTHVFDIYYDVHDYLQNFRESKCSLVEINHYYSSGSGCLSWETFEKQREIRITDPNQFRYQPDEKQ